MSAELYEMSLGRDSAVSLESVPMVTNWMGGRDADSRAALPAAVTWGHFSNAICLDAIFMAKARQVGKPQSLQLVFGRCL